MLVLFHAICFILTELSTPVWQNEVRQITYQFVEAMREAEKKVNRFYGGRILEISLDRSTKFL